MAKILFVLMLRLLHFDLESAVPHVRTGVRGPKMEFFERFPYRPHLHLVLRKEKSSGWGYRPVLFGPCTLVRTWGTRPVPEKVRLPSRCYADVSYGGE